MLTKLFAAIDDLNELDYLSGVVVVGSEEDQIPNKRLILMEKITEYNWTVESCVYNRITMVGYSAGLQHQHQLQKLSSEFLEKV